MKTYNCKFRSPSIPPPPTLLHPWARGLHSPGTKQGEGDELCVFPVTNNKGATTLKVRKTGNKRRATCLATLLQNELNSDVARFTTHIKPVLQQIRLLTGLNMGGKTHNIAIQLVLQQCCKKSCTFFVARFSVPLI